MRPEDDYYHRLFATYILFTFALSWAIWLLIPIIGSSNYFFNLWMGVLGLYGPSIVGIVLSFLFQGKYWQHYIPKWYIFLPYFLGSFFIGIMYMSKWSQIYPPEIAELTFGVIFIIFLCSLLTAYLLSLLHRSPPGFETRNDKPFQIQSQVAMIAFAISLPIIIGLVSYTIQLAILPDTSIFSLTDQISSSFIFPFYLIAFSLLFSGAVNEEVGWRGYITPKLLQRLNPLVVGLMLGFIWSLWHFPLHYFLYEDGSEGFFYRFLWNVPMGVVFTWYYIKSGYNLLGAILLHGTFNLFSFIGEFYIVPAYVLTAIVMIIEEKMWISNYASTSAS